MSDPRSDQLASLLVSYSTKVQPGDHVWIRCVGVAALPYARSVYKKVIEVGGHPYLDIADETLSPFFFSTASSAHLEKDPAIDLFLANWADCIITLVGEENTRALVAADPKKILQMQKIKQPVKKVILSKRWVLTWVPTPALAQESGMSTDDFEEFYFSACLRDWKKESKRIVSLSKRLSHATKIEVIGKDTQLTLSATDRIFIPDVGDCNMPAGEVFTSPVENSVNGVITFDFPLFRFGKELTDIRLEFTDGLITKASASKHEDTLHAILSTDDGAKRLGEFAIGMNPGITRYFNNTLFDEKIEGTIHCAIGDSFLEAGGKNHSGVHMDIVKDMRQPGSKVLADGVTILEDGVLLSS